MFKRKWVEQCNAGEKEQQHYNMSIWVDLLWKVHLGAATKANSFLPLHGQGNSHGELHA
jgi:hypothetical protein